MTLAALRDLVAHKGHANAALFRAIDRHPAARVDAELLALLHHVLLANRFWFLTIRGAPFDVAHEGRPAGSLGELVRRYAESQAQEAAWLDAAGQADLGRRLEGDLIPGRACSVADALLQVCLHTHGHRAQAALLLRRLGGEPPVTDFIVWLVDRPAADWPLALD